MLFTSLFASCWLVQKPSMPIPSAANQALPTKHPSTSSIDQLRFVALGDGGEGNATQYKVGEAIQKWCQAQSDDAPGCDFALYLGDNFYDDGVESVDDPQFHSKFEAPYAKLDFPFYVTLGNHDYGGCVFGKCGAGWEFEKSAAQVEYTLRSSKWTMPAEYYSFIDRHVQFIALDTNAMMWDPWYSSADDQHQWMTELLQQSSMTKWKIAFGHHPFRSNGQHGNAGSYEGLEWMKRAHIASVAIGRGVEDFFDEHLCQKVDVYLSGHDHNRQWLDPYCNVELIVTGSAAKLTPLRGRGNGTRFEDDDTAGFVWIELDQNCLTGVMVDEEGREQYRHHYCK